MTGLALVAFTSCSRDRSGLCESLADTYLGCMPEEARAVVPSRDALIENCMQDFRDCPNEAVTCTDFMNEKARQLTCVVEAGCSGLAQLMAMGVLPANCR